MVDEQMCTELAAVVSFGKNDVANVNLRPENQAFRVRWLFTCAFANSCDMK